MKKHRHTRPDGRYVLFYAFDRALPEVLRVDEPVRGDDRIELRHSALLDEWVIVSTGRQERTFLPPDEYCPLCPTRGVDAFPTEIPAADFEIAVFENRFPSFRVDAQAVADDASLMRRAKADGVCEVVVYAADHAGTLGSMSDAEVRGLVDVWTERYEELGARAEVDYVFIFENRGEEIGVTLSHPHGQIYAFPFVPPQVEVEQRAAAVHHEQTGRCLMCETVMQEIGAMAINRDRHRIVASDGGFVAYVPFGARVPYEVHVAPREHRASLSELSDDERDSLARLLKRVQATYDGLWSRPMAYTMSMHQRATDGIERPGDHLHIEFMPPYRSRDKLKYLAGVETGVGAFINDTLPEEKAGELRSAGVGD